MSSKDAHLYSMPGAKKRARKDITTSGSLGFSSELASLISSSSAQSGRPTAGRSHRQKEDIFSKHNRNTHKRAKRDLEPDDGTFEQKHSTNSDAVDSAAWQRSKQKMEEKARLYAAMKRGDVDDEEGKHMVDFDSKWAEAHDQDKTWDNESSAGSASETEGAEEEIEWQDEFGRTRKGTRKQMERQQRGLEIAAELSERARPSAPSQVIYGDTVQSAAFNPDSGIADKMADLAAKRDRSLTPPPDTHFDASKEVRSKGVGFMQLSLDKEERERQMAALDKDREETQAKRGEREAKMRERREMLEQRRRAIEEKRNLKKADAFLDELGKEMESSNAKDATTDEAASRPPASTG